MKSRETLIFLAAFSLLLGASERTSRSGSDPTLLEKIKLGETNQEIGNFKEAIDIFKSALGQAEATGAREEALGCLKHLAILDWNIGENEEASVIYAKALELALQTNRQDLQLEIQTALAIGRFYAKGREDYFSGQYNRSIRNFNEALRLARNIKSNEHQVKCLRMLSTDYWCLDKFSEFYALNEEGLILAKEVKNKEEEGKYLNNIALYYWKAGQLSNTLSYLEESLSIAKKLGDTKTEGCCLSNLGIAFNDLGNYEKALESLTKALEIDKKLADARNTAKDLNNLGSVFWRKGMISSDKSSISKAISNYNESLSIVKKIKDHLAEVDVLNNLGWSYSGLEDYATALNYYKSALRIANDIAHIEGKGTIYTNLGTIYYSLGKYDDSICFYKKAIDLGLELKSGQILWEAYFGLARCYQEKKENPLALSYYDKSIEIIDHIRSQLSLDTYKAGFIRDKLKVYECLIDFLFRLNQSDPSRKYDEALFLAIEKAKARAFLENLAEGKIDFKVGLSPALKIKEEEISERISSYLLALSNPNPGEQKKLLLENLTQAEDEYMSLISKIRAESPGLGDLISPKPCPFGQIQNQLPDERTVLVEYFLGERRSYLLFFTKKDFGFYSLPARRDIEESLKAYLKLLSAPPQGEFLGNLAASRLFRELLFPLEKMRPGGIENLIIIPDGILYYLPFETLRSASRDRCLVEDFNISYAPSVSSLLYLMREESRPHHRKSLLGVGDPVYPNREVLATQKPLASSEIMREFYLGEGFEISPLPYSRKEISAISRYFPKENKQIYLEREASEDTLKRIPLQDYQVIHFACHGLLDEKVPYRSALVLSQPENSKEDGFLQVREIYSLRIKADLVVLSACQTGRGSLEGSEGILGLPSIFFYSGAKSVVSSLWKISDRSTATFMDHFYCFLSLGNDKAQALRLAKLKMIKSKFSHPFYWAAFVLTGEPRSRLNFDR